MITPTLGVGPSGRTGGAVFNICLSALLALLALLLAAVGIAAITRGWVPPRARFRVRDSRLYGRGMLWLALATGVIAADGVAVTDPDARNPARVAMFVTTLLAVRAMSKCERSTDSGQRSPEKQS